MATHKYLPSQPEFVSTRESEKPFFWTMKMIAERWNCSEDKVGRELEKYRGRDGFMDLGSHGSRYTRKYAIPRIHPTLLAEIEHDRRK
jgi:hypothetical protein